MSQHEFDPKRCIEIFPPEKSPVDFKMQPGHINWSSNGAHGSDTVRAFARALLDAADQLDKLNQAAGV